jgi:hypothetical protein
MAEKLDPSQLVDFREMLMTEIITSEALINLLDKKGIISKQELLMDFSVSGLYVLSKLPFSPGEINISVSFKNRGKIDLIGNIIRVNKEGDMWGIAIDFSKAYDFNALREV